MILDKHGEHFFDTLGLEAGRDDALSLILRAELPYRP